mmetsp:Transcript_16934/g.28213  ORF Transcript_16934/g.28213 Transcript_16934/m.28213 type:complete len:203 (+) Transcript_16934:346-954(+)
MQQSAGTVSKTTKPTHVYVISLATRSRTVLPSQQPSVRSAGRGDARPTAAATASTPSVANEALATLATPVHPRARVERARAPIKPWSGIYAVRAGGAKLGKLAARHTLSMVPTAQPSTMTASLTVESERPDLLGLSSGLPLGKLSARSTAIGSNKGPVHGARIASCSVLLSISASNRRQRKCPSAHPLSTSGSECTPRCSRA